MRWHLYGLWWMKYRCYYDKILMLSYIYLELHHEHSPDDGSDDNWHWANTVKRWTTCFITLFVNYKSLQSGNCMFTLENGQWSLFHFLNYNAFLAIYEVSKQWAVSVSYAPVYLWKFSFLMHQNTQKYIILREVFPVWGVAQFI